MVKERCLERRLLDLSDGVIFRINDVFGYGCADSQFVDEQDLDKLLGVYGKFGIGGLYAFISKIRRETPVKELRTKNYRKARDDLEDYKLKGDYSE